MNAFKGEKPGAGAEGAQQPWEEVKKPSEAEDAVQKKKSDDLWASFLSDVGSRPKDCTPTPSSQSSITHKVN